MPQTISDSVTKKVPGNSNKDATNFSVGPLLFLVILYCFCAVFVLFLNRILHRIELSFFLKIIFLGGA